MNAMKTGIIYRPTRVVTNCPVLGNLLQKKCCGKHRHASTTSSRDANAIYPVRFCDIVLKGISIELVYMNEYVCGAEEQMVEQDPVDEREYWCRDDVTGEALDVERVKEARAEEMRTFKEMGVYEYWTREKMRRVQGHIKVGSKWVDTDKGGGRYRSRLVAMEFANKDRDGIFAATPPLSAFRALASECATCSPSGRFEKQLMVMDIKRAFLYGDIERDVFVELPSEDPMSATGMFVGKLKRTMYGTRDAPAGFQTFLGKVMIKLGFKVCKSTPCVYYHDARDLRAVAHVDDILTSGRIEGLRWFRTALGKVLEISCDILGTCADELDQIKYLGRFVRLCKHGLEVEGDSKVVKSLIVE